MYEALPKSEKDTLAKRGKAAVPTVLRHFEVAIRQRNVQLLGRSVDLNGILSKKVQAYVAQDLQVRTERRKDGWKKGRKSVKEISEGVREDERKE